MLCWGYLGKDFGNTAQGYEREFLAIFDVALHGIVQFLTAFQTLTENS